MKKCDVILKVVKNGEMENSRYYYSARWVSGYDGYVVLRGNKRTWWKYGGIKAYWYDEQVIIGFAKKDESGKRYTAYTDPVEAGWLREY